MFHWRINNVSQLDSVCVTWALAGEGNCEKEGVFGMVSPGAPSGSLSNLDDKHWINKPTYSDSV